MIEQSTTEERKSRHHFCKLFMRILKPNSLIAFYTETLFPM